MITINDIKDELRVTGDSEDSTFERRLLSIKAYLAGYINRNIEYIDENPGLDEVVLYLAILSLNPDTRLRAGKQSESAGLTVSFLDDLPPMYKTILASHRKARFI